jgi:hypothetical protein
MIIGVGTPIQVGYNDRDFSVLLSILTKIRMKTVHKLLVICLGALALRLLLIGAIHHPGISDPNHYYNLGRELANGNGFQIDYIWHYYNPPEAVVHPTDWWLPLTGVIAAVGMVIGGVNVQAAIVPFALLGALIPVLAYVAARQFGCSEGASLFAAAAAGVLPEYYLNSLRTNTLIPNVVLVSAALVLFVRWWQSADQRALLLSGIMIGLGYLTRGEDLLLVPAFGASLVVYGLVKRESLRQWPYLVGALGLAFLVVLPWLLRNHDVWGWYTFPDQGRIFFWTDFRDLYAYDRPLTFETMLEAQGWSGIIGKRAFEMLASVKIMIVDLDLLAVPVIGGVLLLAWRRDRDRWLVLAPTIFLLAGFFVFYTGLAPYFSQGGSFKKAYLSLVPLLVPLGAYALEAAIPAHRLRIGAMVLIVALLALNAVEVMREDIRFTNDFLDSVEKVVAELDTLPDTTGDGEIVVMTQDQFVMSFLGVKAVQIPFERREKILEVAQRYNVDYLLMPPARPALDPLFDGTESDPRFVPVRAIAGTNMVLYRFDFDAP